MAVAAAGASPSANGAPNEDGNVSVVGGAGRSRADLGVAEVSAASVYSRGRVEGRAGGAAGEGTAAIVSPAVISKAKRLVVGVSNIDTSVAARKLASQALDALGGGEV